MDHNKSLKPSSNNLMTCHIAQSCFFQYTVETPCYVLHKIPGHVAACAVYCIYTHNDLYTGKKTLNPVRPEADSKMPSKSVFLMSRRTYFFLI